LHGRLDALGIARIDGLPGHAIDVGHRCEVARGGDDGVAAAVGLAHQALPDVTRTAENEELFHGSIPLKFWMVDIDVHCTCSTVPVQ